MPPKVDMIQCGLLRVRNRQRRIPINTPVLTLRTHTLLRLLKLRSYALEVDVTTDERVRRYNRMYRGKDKTTDILSFPFMNLRPWDERKTPHTASDTHNQIHDAPAFDSAEHGNVSGDISLISPFPTMSRFPGRPPLPPSPVHGIRDLGQILISAPQVARDASNMGIDVDRRMRTLIIHGLCHLLGYDHETALDAALMDVEECRLSELLETEEARRKAELKDEWMLLREEECSVADEDE